MIGDAQNPLIDGRPFREWIQDAKAVGWREGYETGRRDGLFHATGSTPNPYLKKG